MRSAHHRDGLAMVRLLAWLDRQDPAALSEIDVVRQLEALRRDQGILDISFDTIMGAGPNGAIVHYRVTEATNRRLAAGDLLLIDSGGQYADGTTDITRTVPLGDPRPDAVGPFTAVLRGMIALSRARFPTGVTGGHLDALARQFLWSQGLDYDHGTGHGVGAALCVHEGPARISRVSDVPLEPGMILSNEPGYYREGSFGIRSRNLIVVTQADAETGPPDAGFDTLTLCPIDRRLIDRAALSADDVAWLDAYHAQVRISLSPDLQGQDLDWLTAATEPLGRCDIRGVRGAGSPRAAAGTQTSQQRQDARRLVPARCQRAAILARMEPRADGGRHGRRRIDQHPRAGLHRLGLPAARHAIWRPWTRRRRQRTSARPAHRQRTAPFPGAGAAAAPAWRSGRG